MYYKEPELNKKGQPLCEICNVGYDRLLRHVGHRHEMNAVAYKKKFGYHPRKGIVSKKVAFRARKNALKNYNTVILPNLVIGGIDTRFSEGNNATDIEMVRKIGRQAMNQHWSSRRKSKEDLYAELIRVLRFKK